MATTGLAEFKQVAADFTDLGALALKLAVAAPLIDLAAKVGPPPVAAVSTLTCAAEFLAVIWTFHFWSALSFAQQSARMRVALISFCVFLITCIGAIEMFTLSPGAGRERVVEGFALLPATARVISPLFSPQDALMGAQFDASQVWTQSSITVVHLGLIICWLAAFASLAIFICLFVIAQRRRKDVETAAS